MSRIRVWFVRTALDAIGGAERVIAKVMRGLPKDRFDVAAVWLYEAGVHGEQLQREGIRTYSGLGRSRVDVRLPLRLIRLAHQERPNIIFTTENALACFWTSMLKRWRLCKRLVIGFHTTRMERRSSRIAVRSAAPVADALVTLTKTHQQYWQSLTNQPAERFVIIPNGINTKHFAPVADRYAHRQQLGVPPEACIIGLIAYFKPVKNLPLFIEVAGRVATAVEDSFFVLVGDGDEREKIEAIIHDRGLGTRFCLPGAVDDPAPWHQAFDVLLLTSHSEAMPVVVLEANSCAVPAVATDVGGVRDVIMQGQTGFYAPAGDADALAQHVMKLCKAPQLRQQMGFAARQHVIQHFSEEVMVRHYAELFEQLAQRRTRDATAPLPEK